ncbi:MAG: response regulator [Candidatus Thermoplasmatota archaeon]|nr:response regulator [Euryarchaeota archaeon]MBU4031591.1 response regulator [Candidatus Thermoplasmatota archaeon]MBU4071634.1 response regulator [Candidatus Thermoplasmatota archaeon]MBU4144698.1 response regulator [Candidatus Thermoplasmatota archaeon]MBU4592677.1 response regulator [Candidatus Thermoplasmatota archaeon]
MNTLIAEDNTASRILLEKILKTLGHEVTSAENGTIALNLYKNGKFDMVFLDWMMPGMNGVDVCKEIKAFDVQNGKNSYIIMVTSKTKKEDVLTALEAGADDFLSKPINSSVLESRINLGRRMKHSLTTNAMRILEDEHKVLLRMANILEAIGDRVGRVTVSPKILEWCKSTALLLNTNVHHAKEDHFILMFLERAIAVHGESPNSRVFSRSSLKTIDEEHAQLLQLLEKMQLEIDSYGRDGTANAASLKKTLSDYVNLTRNHIHREEKYLFPLARKYLSDDDMGTLLGQFSHIENDIGLEKLDKRTHTLLKMEEALNLSKTRKEEIKT